MFYAKLHGFLGIFKFVVAGQDHELGVFIQGVYFFYQLQAGKDGHFDICQYDLGIFV